MKTRAQKEGELANARALFEKSEALIFADFTKITAENLRKLRMELKKSGANFLVIKKRILGILLKEKGIDVDLKQFKTSVGTIFSEVDSEHIAGPAFKFFSGMEVPEGQAKDVWIKKILAGYDLNGKTAMDAEQIIYIGKLPPREVVLAQLLGMLAAPIRSFLYILDEKSKMGGGAQPVAESPAPAAEPETSSPDPESPEQKVELTQAQ
ncbi:MAG TPA: 50S ribosomal protein L10 [Candidatus Paceibacterota bacterium]|nr:50S ribosomal protein L10 [Candidatus Paceibacterota bacterium]